MPVVRRDGVERLLSECFASKPHGVPLCSTMFAGVLWGYIWGASRTCLNRLWYHQKIGRCLYNIRKSPNVVTTIFLNSAYTSELNRNAQMYIIILILLKTCFRRCKYVTVICYTPLNDSSGYMGRCPSQRNFSHNGYLQVNHIPGGP
jgi:hypothetical protein